MATERPRAKTLAEASPEAVRRSVDRMVAEALEQSGHEALPDGRIVPRRRGRGKKARPPRA